MNDPISLSPLTAALVNPLRVDHCTVTAAAIARCSSELSSLVAHRSGGGPFRLTDYVIRNALGSSEAAPPQVRFSWSASTARRSIGLAALRSLSEGTTHSPVDGVAFVIDQAIGDVAQGLRPVSSMDEWLANLSAAGRAAVQADAITWCTRLWTSVQFGAFATPPTIGRDHWWDSPQSSLLALRSRAEVRSTATGPGGKPVSVHLVVLNGPRRATIQSELSVVALVEALRTSDPLLPGRIVGWWPDSGRFVTLDVVQATLSAGVATVARTLTSIGASQASNSAATEAAA